MVFEPGEYYNMLEAVMHGEVNVVKKYLDSGIPVDSFNNGEEDLIWNSAIQYACFYGHLEVTKVLLEHGANVHDKTNKSLVSCLHRACQKGYIEISELLLDYGANKNAKDIDGNTPLHGSCRYAQSASVSLLLSHGAHATIRNNRGYLPLDEARRMDRTSEIVPMLITHCSDLPFENERNLLHVVLTCETMWNKANRGEPYYWKGGIEDIVNANPQVLQKRDPQTGLLPFQLAATRKQDVESGFELLRNAPYVL